MLWTDCLTRLRQGSLITSLRCGFVLLDFAEERLSGVMRLYAPNPYWTRYIPDNHLELISILAEHNFLKVEYVKLGILSRFSSWTILSSKVNNQQQRQPFSALNAASFLYLQKLKRFRFRCNFARMSPKVQKKRQLKSSVCISLFVRRSFQPNGG